MPAAADAGGGRCRLWQALSTLEDLSNNFGPL